jgi:hypothetical protein
MAVEMEEAGAEVHRGGLEIVLMLMSTIVPGVMAISMRLVVETDAIIVLAEYEEVSPNPKNL